MQLEQLLVILTEICGLRGREFHWITPLKQNDTIPLLSLVILNEQHIGSFWFSVKEVKGPGRAQVPHFIQHMSLSTISFINSFFD